MQIAEGAIECYADIGYALTTFEKIAEKCKISRPLIKHYFDTREEVFDFSIRYIRANFQRLAIEYIGEGRTTLEKLERYVTSTFHWLDRFPTHIRVWIYYLHYCSIVDSMKEQNTEFVNIGHDRIAALIQLGIDEGKFNVSDLRAAAKQVQVIISGALITCVCEDLYVTRKEFESQTLDLCYKIVGYSESSSGLT